MARARNPDRDKAFEIYKKHAGKIDLVEIASQLNISPGTIRGWKSKDSWEKQLNGTFQKNTERSKRKKGGQPGNKNAEGHGGTGPPGNKNAVRTGEFETLFFDTLEPEEKAMAGLIQPDKEKLLLREIQLLTVRERRMLKRIETLKLLETSSVSEEQGEDTPGKLPAGMLITKFKAGIEKGEITSLKEYESILGQIQSVEDALTRVQARQQKAIEMLHKFGYEDARLELENQQFEYKKEKDAGITQELEDMDGIEKEIYGALKKSKKGWSPEKKNNPV